MNTSAAADDPLRIYCNCLQSVKHRLALIDAITTGAMRIDIEAIDAEFVCLQLRKSLELVAFASIAAQKDVYSAEYADFSQHWNAKKLMNRLERLHPEFYPTPVLVTGPDERGVKKLVPIKEGFINKDDWVFLYDTCSAAIHEWNPYRTDPKIIEFGHSIGEWVVRLRRLLELHWVRLASTRDIWVIQFNNPAGTVTGFRTADAPP